MGSHPYKGIPAQEATPGFAGLERRVRMRYGEDDKLKHQCSRLMEAETGD